MTENRMIHTADELDATPYGTIIMAKEGTPYQHNDDAPNWYGPYGNKEWANQVLGLGPVTVLHEPEEPKPVLPTTTGSVVRADNPTPAWAMLHPDGQWYSKFGPCHPDVWPDGWVTEHDAGAEN